MLTATMFLAGCSQDEELTDAPILDTSDLVDIIIDAPREHHSRLSYDDTDTPFAWENGDQIIAVGFTADGSYKGQQVYSMKGELTDDRTTATFTGQLIEGAEQYKVYYKAPQLTISTTDGTPEVNYDTQSADLTSAQTQTVHMKNFYQLATPEVTLSALLDTDTPKNLKLENSLLRLDVKSYPAGIGTLEKIIMRTNIANGSSQATAMSFTNVPAEQQSFKAFMLFDPTVMAQTSGETFEIVFVGDKGMQSISKDQTKATFNNAGSRYNLIAFQNDSEIQEVTTQAVLNNWTVWSGVTIDKATQTITTKWAGFITPEDIKTAMDTTRTLNIKGDINGRDIKAIREAAGCMYDNSQNPALVNAPLRILDMSGATIKASADKYAEEGTNAYYTEDNKIGAYMFNISALQSFKFPKGITEIGDFAFRANFILSDIEIPETVTKMGKAVFWQNEKLTSIVIPDNVTSVGSNLLSGCKKLESIKLSENCTIIPNQMLYQCTALESITIPEAVTEISYWAFSQTKIETLVVPAAVEIIREGFLKGVTTLKKLTFKGAKAQFDLAFENFTASENCDLVIPEEWKDKVSTDAEGKSVFEGLTWKSVKTTAQ